MHPKDFQDIEKQAVQWLVRLDRGGSPELATEHEAWMALSIWHKVLYVKHQSAWKRMDILKRIRPLEHLGKVADPDLLKPHAPATWFSLSAVAAAFAGAGWMPKATAAAATVAMIAIVAAVVLRPSGDITHSTGVGQQRTVTLDDGTRLTLNTNSKARVRFSADRRRIFLDRGELMLAVAHDESRPLEVIARDVTSRAVGTKFSVRVHDEDARVETLVTEGRVLVLRQSHLLGIPLKPQAVTRTLDAGEKVVVGSRGAEVSRVTAKQVDRQLMWKTGRIELNGDPLTDVVHELNRYNRRKLVILDPAISTTAIGGAFNTSNADSYAQHLIRYFGVERLNAEPQSR
jgi:transmembrane sensor